MLSANSNAFRNLGCYRSGLPLEVALPSPRVDNIDLSADEEKPRGNLDLLEEAKEAAQVWMAMYQCRVSRYYNSKVRT